MKNDRYTRNTSLILGGVLSCNGAFTNFRNYGGILKKSLSMKNMLQKCLVNSKTSENRKKKKEEEEEEEEEE